MRKHSISRTITYLAFYISSVWGFDLNVKPRRSFPITALSNTDRFDVSISPKNPTKRSAFGKAAIGRARDVKSTAEPLVGAPFINSTISHTVQLREHGDGKHPANDTAPVEMGSASDRYADNTIESRRQNAIQALKTHLSMSKKESLVLLEACPRLYTEITDLSSKLHYLLHDINIKTKQLRKMIQFHPRLMETVFLDSEANIKSTVEILQTELEMSTQDIKMMESQSLPAILNYPRSELRKRILVYKLDLKLDTQELKALVLKDPRVLRTDSKNVRRIIKVLEDELDLSIDNVHTMLRKEILLLTYRAEENIRPTILYLKNNEIGKCLGMVERKGVSTLATYCSEQEQQEIIKMRLKALVMGNPKILSSSLEKNLVPTVAFFLNYVGMTELELGRLIYRRGGSLLEANVERSLKRKIDFFRQELDLVVNDDDDDDDDDRIQVTTQQMPHPNATATLTGKDKKRLLAQMLATNPDILTLSIDSNLAPKFEYLTHRMGFTRTQLSHILLKRPQLLALSLDRNIIPKMECFLAPRQGFGLGMSNEEVRNWITDFPQTLTCQLETRIRPRIRDAVRLDLYIGRDLPPNFITRSNQSWQAIVERKATLTTVANRRSKEEGSEQGLAS